MMAARKGGHHLGGQTAMRSPQVNHLIIAFACVPCLATVASRHAVGQVSSDAAQVTTPAHLANEQDAGNLAPILSLAQPGELAIVVDHGTRVPRKVTEQGGTRAERLERIAALLDYSVEWHGPRMAVLRKRFEDPRERPQFVLPELQSIARQALSGLPSGPSIGDWGGRIRTLAASLSAEQMRSIKVGRHLTFADLNARQRALLRDTILSRTSGARSAQWQQYRDLLDRVDQSAISVYGSEQYPNVSPGVLIARITIPRPGLPDWQTDIGSWQTSKPEEEDRLRAVTPAATSARSLPPGASAHQPPAGDARGQQVHPPSGSIPIGEILRTVTAGATGGLKLKAAPEIEDHVVCVSADGITAATLMDALAAIGDWVWEQRDASTFLLRPTRPWDRKDGPEVADPLDRLWPRDMRLFLKVITDDGKPHNTGIEDLRSRASLGLEMATRDLLTFTMAMKAGDRKPWARLAREQREDLLARVTFILMDGLESGHIDAAAALPNALEKCEVYLDQELLMVSLERPGGGRAEFGRNIMRDDMGRPLQSVSAP
jgi:hypothetical protein